MFVASFSLFILQLSCKYAIAGDLAFCTDSFDELYAVACSVVTHDCLPCKKRFVSIKSVE